MDILTYNNSSQNLMRGGASKEPKSGESTPALINENYGIFNMKTLIVS